MLRIAFVRRRAFRAVVVAIFAAAALVATAVGASAEEALVLDNGTILRGTVMKEDGKQVVLQLAGVGTDGRVTVDRARIVQRFVTVEPQKGAARTALDGVGRPGTAPRLVESVPFVPLAAIAPTIPAEEPRAADENFFSRTARRAAVALPSESGPRAFLAILAIVVALCLVGLACRMADVEGLTLGKGTVLAGLFVAMATIDIGWADTALRADWAPLLVPLEILAWVGCAAGLLRCGLGRAFNVLAFVLLSSALVVFSTGVMLVSV